eukprot:GEMP01004237.1.p1 GENE.GEMP01004237.1~~GEMP01004237.1.p1  ORF type:complete len:266 (+),score=61.46 GEMP01004237.1:43-798(+)
MEFGGSAGVVETQMPEIEDFIRLQHQMEKMEASVQQYHYQAGFYRTQIKVLSEEVQLYQEEILKKDTQLAQKDKQIRGKTSEQERWTKRLEATMLKMGCLQERAQSAVQELRDENAALEGELAAQNRVIEDLQDESFAKDAAIGHLQDRLSAKDADIRDLGGNLIALKQGVTTRLVAKNLAAQEFMRLRHLGEEKPDRSDRSSSTASQSHEHKSDRPTEKVPSSPTMTSLHASLNNIENRLQNILHELCRP